MSELQKIDFDSVRTGFLPSFLNLDITCSSGTAITPETVLSRCLTRETLLGKEYFNNSATLEEKEDENNVNIDESNQDWIQFCLSLFPNARSFTKDEQKKIEDHKKKIFKTITIDI